MSTQNQKNYLSQSIPFIFGLLLLIVEAILAPLQVTLSSLFLFGAWMGDLYLKNSLGFGTETSFADLNFASVVFVMSRFVALIGDGYNSQNPILLLQVLVVIFIISFVWVINLHISREMSNQHSIFRNVTVGTASWWASLGMSFTSAIAVIILQEIGII